MTGQRPLQGMRIGLLTASASRAGAGVFEAVLQQAAMIRALGGEALIFALHDAYSDTDAVRFVPSTVATFPVSGPRQFGYAPGLVKALIDAELDLLHLHGIWMYPSRAATQWRRATKRPYLISAHGMLDPTTVNRRPWKKAIGRIGYEQASWRAADAFHALTKQEAANIRGQVGKARVIVIPNAAPMPNADNLRDMPAPKYLFLGRIHAQKNLRALMSAWRIGAMDRNGGLLIAGWGDPAEEARVRADADYPGSAVRLLGPVHGAEKQALLASARFMVLPSLGEAMPMSILEGWAAGLPAIISTQSNLPEGIAAGAALACETDPASIAAALRQAAAMNDDEWQAMSRAGVALVEGPFSAQTVAAQWARAYRGESLE
ncbi:glycosyltransferase [Novosphingobium aquiterrae]|uniref:Glycosyltransferase n=1 Tax=Novosphingobium aquiterrae TaxID=624388 RepID=A0ABV6PFS1_9SPHN